MDSRIPISTSIQRIPMKNLQHKRGVEEEEDNHTFLVLLLFNRSHYPWLVDDKGLFVVSSDISCSDLSAIENQATSSQFVFCPGTDHE